MRIRTRLLHVISDETADAARFCVGRTIIRHALKIEHQRRASARSPLVRWSLPTRNLIRDDQPRIAAVDLLPGLRIGSAARDRHYERENYETRHLATR